MKQKSESIGGKNSAASQGRNPYKEVICQGCGEVIEVTPGQHAYYHNRRTIHPVSLKPGCLSKYREKQKGTRAKAREADPQKWYIEEYTRPAGIPNQWGWL